MAIKVGQFPKKQNAKLTGMDGPLLHGILGAVAIVEGDIRGDLFPKVVAIEPPVGEEHRCWCGGIGTARSRARHDNNGRDAESAREEENRKTRFCSYVRK